MNLRGACFRPSWSRIVRGERSSIARSSPPSLLPPPYRVVRFLFLAGDLQLLYLAAVRLSSSRAVGALACLLGAYLAPPRRSVLQHRHRARPIIRIPDCRFLASDSAQWNRSSAWVTSPHSRRAAPSLRRFFPQSVRFQLKMRFHLLAEISRLPSSPGSVRPRFSSLCSARYNAPSSTSSSFPKVRGIARAIPCPYWEPKSGYAESADPVSPCSNSSRSASH